VENMYRKKWGSAVRNKCIALGQKGGNVRWPRQGTNKDANSDDVASSAVG